MIRADGVKTTSSYDARQRLKTQLTGAALTSFDYWPTGKLKQAILPSGLVINYLYDAAQRLIEVNDNRGNRVVYTLNNMSLVVQEDRYDPDGTLTVGLAQVQGALLAPNAIEQAM